MMSARNTLAIVSACLSLVALVVLSSAAGTLYGFTETSNAVLVYVGRRGRARPSQLLILPSSWWRLCDACACV